MKSSSQTPLYQPPLRLENKGKTKKIYSLPPHPLYGPTVLIYNTDFITVGDGERCYEIPGKGALATATTIQAFRAMQCADVENHFLEFDDVGCAYLESVIEGQTIRQIIESCGGRAFIARKVSMFKFEFVVRETAWGSFPKRYPDILPRTKLPRLVGELFEKDDARHDPLVVFDSVSETVLFYNPRLPRSSGFLSERPLEPGEDFLIENLVEASGMAKRAFRCMSGLFAKTGHELVDFKLEFGVLLDDEGDPTDRIVAADCYDGDSGRVWPGGDPTKALDKQYLRDIPHDQTDESVLAKLMQNYQLLLEVMQKWNVDRV